ncbi:MAG: tetratricopeptide repeat protein [Flavobacteriales bacterium]
MKQAAFSLFAFFFVVACNSKKGSENDLSYDEAFDKANEYNQNGLDARARGDFEEAKLNGRKAIAFTSIAVSDQCIMLRNMAENYIALEEYDSARYFYSQVFERTMVNTFYYYVCKADIYLIDHDVENALPMLLEANKIDPNTLEVNNMLGLIYLGDYDEEYSNYEKALSYNRVTFDLSKDHNSVIVYLKNLYYLEMYTRGEEVFDEQYPNHKSVIDILYYGCLIKTELGKTDEAEELKAKVIELDAEYASLFESEEESEEEYVEEEEETKPDYTLKKSGGKRKLPSK